MSDCDSPRRDWTAPELRVLPPLTDLTLQATPGGSEGEGSSIQGDCNSTTPDCSFS